ncbi:MAG: tetratricopeptide repeat protein [Candidatus Latescibacterota bacterium]|nr:MAG: tetratricopeptide repeat protein [Candidatus Latescibacterota bacterium]
MILLFATGLCACFGCSKEKKALASIKNEYSNQNYEEAIVLCEHALRKNILDGDIYYYYGMSLLAVGRDYESFDRFEQAVRLDSSLATRIADHLGQRASESFSAGRVKKAAQHVMTAAELDPDADFGVLTYLVAEGYFNDGEFSKATRFYEAALGEFPDTTAAEGAYFSLAECYLALGDSTEAVQTLERQLSRFPRGALADRAQWTLVNMLYESARAEFGRGNYEAVLEIGSDLLKRTKNVSLVQRTRFVLGEAHERMGDYVKAYEQYQAIISEDRGASGRIVERARAKIEAFRDAGLF